MRIRILKPGLLSTIQDMGRYGYLSQAVAVSGAMDTLSARLANIAIGNDENAAVIEFTYANAEFVAETDLVMAYAGDGAILSIDIGDIPGARPVYIPAGTVVNLKRDEAGTRTYLAIAGGWDVPVVLGSRSTYITAAIGGLQGRQLQQGDVLDSAVEISAITRDILISLHSTAPNYTNWSLARRLFLPVDKKVIRIVRGNEFDWFEEASLNRFFTTPYTLSLRNNRMGCHLEGAAMIRKEKGELLSTAVTPGTIQVTGNGSMILLMADCQTTGGYPRIAQVAAVDLPLCAQFKPGDEVFFKEISRQEAEMLYIEREKQLRELAGVITEKYNL